MFDGGVRPIAVSHLFLKVAGLMAIVDSGCTVDDHQHAVGKLEGTKIIIHKLRKHKSENKVISKFDVVNAFNEMPRAVCEEAIRQEVAPQLKAYFRAVYYHSSSMVLYGPDCESVTIAAEGVRQGDAVSSFLFCKGLDHIIRKIRSIAQDLDIKIVEILSYMDDLTIVTDNTSDALQVADIVRWVFGEYKMRVDLTARKSAIFVSRNDPFWTDPTMQEVQRGLQLQVIDHSQQFVVLGADLSDDPTSFLQEKEKKIEKFLVKVDRLDIHPALVFTLLRLCGNPRLAYLCSVMPMCDALQRVLRAFDSGMKRVLNGPQLLRGFLRDTVMIYEREGAGMVNYAAIATELFLETQRRTFATKTAASLNISPFVGLVSTDPSLPVQRRANSSDWMFFVGSKFELSPAEFVGALAQRLLQLPERVNLPCTCDCQTSILTEVEFIDHTLKCDRFTNFCHKHRHECVVNDALVPVARAYGYTTVVEPRCYTYADAHAKRPDVIFSTTPRLAIDVTVVFPHGEVGLAAAAAAQAKVAKHEQAVQAMGHKFLPFAAEVWGHLDQSALDVIKALARGLSTIRRHSFYVEMNHAISVALARGRSNSILSAIAKQKAADRWRGYGLQ